MTYNGGETIHVRTQEWTDQAINVGVIGSTCQVMFYGKEGAVCVNMTEEMLGNLVDAASRVLNTGKRDVWAPKFVNNHRKVA